MFLFHHLLRHNWGGECPSCIPKMQIAEYIMPPGGPQLSERRGSLS